MKLKHQSTPQPQTVIEAANKQHVTDAISTALQVLFSWNHTDVSQFTLTDPSAHGWTVGFVAATTSEPEHILVTAPNTAGASTAYLMITAGISVADYEVVAVHDFFGTGVETVSLLARADDISGGVFAGARWSMGGTAALEGFYAGGFGDTVIAADIEVVPAAPPVVVETHLSTRGLALGKGWGRLANYGSIDASTEAGLGTSLESGMRFTHATTSLQTLKIYNWFAIQRAS